MAAIKDDIKALLFDFSRTLIFPRDKTYRGDLNPLHRKLKSENKNYNFFSYFRLNTELLDYLARLSDRFSLYIFTSGSIQNAPEIADKLRERFKEIYSAEQLDLSKKDPSAYEYLIKILELPGKEILFIDDSIGNIEAAKKAGLKTFLYTSNTSLISELEKLKIDR